jgi:hypothetical protein
LLLAMFFGLQAGLIFTTQTQAHAAILAPVAGRVAPVMGAFVADTIAGAFTSGSTGDLNYFHGGNGGTGTGGPGDGASQSPAGKSSRAGRFAELAATVFGMGAFEIGWGMADGQDTTYADAVASPGTSGGWSVVTAPPSGSWELAQGGYGTMSWVDGGRSEEFGYHRWQAAPVVDGLTVTATLESMVPSSTTLYSWQFDSQGTVLRCQNPTTLAYVQAGGTTVMPATPTATDTWAPVTRTFTCPSGTEPRSLDINYPTDPGKVWTRYDLAYAPSAGSESPGATPLTTTTTTQCSGGASSSTVTRYQPADDTFPHFTGSCPPGQTVTGITQTTTRDSDGATVASPISPASAPVVPDAYPDCQPLGSCVLTLLRMAPDGALLANCQGSGACVGWQTEASPSTGSRTRTVTRADGTVGTEPAWVYRDQTWLDCRYGPYVVPTSDCSVVPTEPHADAAPEADEDNCNASDFSFNPISWVVVPLKCLFIPRQSVVQFEAGKVKEAWDATAPATALGIVTDVAGPFSELPDSKGDCIGPEVTVRMPIVGPVTSHPFNACLPLIELVLSWLVPMESAIIYLAALVKGSRMVASSIGAQTL